MRIGKVVLASLLVAAPAIAFAGPLAVPEPETLLLLAIGAVALVIARRKGGRK